MGRSAKVQAFFYDPGILGDPKIGTQESRPGSVPRQPEAVAETAPPSPADDACRPSEVSGEVSREVSGHRLISSAEGMDVNITDPQPAQHAQRAAGDSQDTSTSPTLAAQSVPQGEDVAADLSCGKASGSTEQKGGSLPELDWENDSELDALVKVVDMEVEGNNMLPLWPYLGHAMLPGDFVL